MTSINTKLKIKKYDLARKNGNESGSIFIFKFPLILIKFAVSYTEQRFFGNPKKELLYILYRQISGSIMYSPAHMPFNSQRHPASRI